jgi:uncharacterized protein YsxB (DUF464 family)
MRCVAITSKGHTVQRQSGADMVCATVSEVTVAAILALLA